MLATLILAASISQTVGVVQQTNPTKLTPAQVTAVGSHIAARWPVALANVISFDCTRERESCYTPPGPDGVYMVPVCNPAHIECSPVASEALTSAKVFALLRAQQPVPAGIDATSQSKQLAPRVYNGTDLTNLAAFVLSLWPEVGTSTYLWLHIQREDQGKVTAVARYCKQVTEAEAWAMKQAGASLEPCQP